MTNDKVIVGRPDPRNNKVMNNVIMKVMSININKKHLISLSFIICHLSFSVALTSCQDKDIEREAMALKAPDASQITGQLNGDDYTWT